jgi:hypothetical protein
MKKQDGIYERKNGKYLYLGHQWSGFPSDGIWLVQDGRSNMSCLIGAKEKVPIHALPFRVWESELCKTMYDVWKHKSASLQEMARIACDFFAEKVMVK